MVPMRIDAACHIVLSVSPTVDSLGAGCAMYSHLLRRHKNVTLFCATSPLSTVLNFLPWFAKVTATFPKDADLVIRFGLTQPPTSGYYGDVMTMEPHRDGETLSISQLLYAWFSTHSIKINGKMANALYAGLLEGTRWFGDTRCAGKTFAMAEALIGLGANHAQCSHALLHRRSLAFLRMKGTMLGGMKLLLNGRVALFEVDAPLLEATGATIAECAAIMEEALTLTTVIVALLIVEDRYGALEVFVSSHRGIACDTLLQSYDTMGCGQRAHAKITHKKSCAIKEEIMKKTMEVIG